MKRRPRVLFDFEAFSDQSRGGVSRYVLELASRLSDEIDVLLEAGFHRSLTLAEHNYTWAKGRYFPPVRATGEFRRRLNAVLTRRAIRAFKPDIVHRTYHRHVATYPGTHREILTLYDFTYFHFPDLFAGGEVVRRNMARAAGTVTGCICISEKTRSDAIAMFGPRMTHAAVIPLGVSSADAIRKMPRPIGTSYLLFVGQRAGYKDFDVVLDAMAATPFLSSFDLLAFGGGRIQTRERQKIIQLGLESRVHHLQGDDEALAAAYAHASALVYPSRYEGFGLPLLEAMTHGCPLVCSQAGALPETAGEAAEYFQPGDSVELAEAIMRAVSPGSRREERRRLGLDRAAAFSWDRCAQSTLNFYEATASF